MSRRNHLFRKAKSILNAEGVTGELATNQIKQAFKSHGGFTRGLFIRSNYGGVVPDIDNIWLRFPEEFCSNQNQTTPTCDKRAKFRLVFLFELFMLP